MFHGITPAFLPSGSTTEESASAFFEMTLGHAPKIKKSESESAAFDTTTAWPGTDAIFAIVQQVIDFGQSSKPFNVAMVLSRSACNLLRVQATLHRAQTAALRIYFT